MNSKIRLSKKMGYIFIGLLVLSIGLSSCSKKEEKINTLEKEKLIMGLDDTFAPMGFRDENDNLVGFDIDLANAVSDTLGKEIVFQPIDWSMKETELASGNIDLIWNGYSITDEREEKVLFSDAYLENNQIIVVLSGSDINSKEDLEGKKVAVQNGSSTLKAINEEPELVEKFDSSEPILFDTNHEALMDLEAGRVDAVVSDEVLSRYYISKKNEDDYKILDDNFGEEEYAVGVRKNDEELKKEIDRALSKLKDDGVYDEIYLKWFSK